MTFIVKKKVWDKIEFSDVIDWKTYYAWEYTQDALLTQKEFLEYQIADIDDKLALFPK